MALHQKSIDYLISIDRQLFLNEIKSKQDEINRLISEATTYQENERLLKRESKLLLIII
jgi:hypothetical protein